MIRIDKYQEGDPSDPHARGREVAWAVLVGLRETLKVNKVIIVVRSTQDLKEFKKLSDTKPPPPSNWTFDWVEYRLHDSDKGLEVKLFAADMPPPKSIAEFEGAVMFMCDFDKPQTENSKKWMVSGCITNVMNGFSLG